MYIRLLSKKADGNASGFYKYPSADEIQTRSNPHKSRVFLPPWTRQTLKSERNSKTQLYKFEQELSKHPEFESEPTATMVDSAAQTTSSAIDDAAICGLKVTFGLII